MALAAALPAAQADPTDPTPPPYRALVGVGSDTIEGVMNAMSNAIKVDGTKIIASYDATGSAEITTKDPATNPDCTFARPNGSSGGRQALADSINAGNGCIQFARSSSGPKDFGAPLTHIPFALDAVTFAVRSDGDVPKTLSQAEVIAIYKCEDTSYVPVLPQVKSGSRDFWLSKMGVTDAEIEQGAYPCLLPKSQGGTGAELVQEHDGMSLKKNEIMPFSIGAWIAESLGQRQDVRGLAVLGALDDIAPIVINESTPYTRNVYNVIPTEKVSEPESLEYKTFVGTNSYICQNASVLQLNGFGSIGADCGDTSRTSN